MHMIAYVYAEHHRPHCALAQCETCCLAAPVCPVCNNLTIKFTCVCIYIYIYTYIKTYIHVTYIMSGGNGKEKI